MALSLRTRHVTSAHLSLDTLEFSQAAFQRLWILDDFTSRQDSQLGDPEIDADAWFLRRVRPWFLFRLDKERCVPFTAVRFDGDRLHLAVEPDALAHQDLLLQSCHSQAALVHSKLRRMAEPTTIVSATFFEFRRFPLHASLVFARTKEVTGRRVKIIRSFVDGPTRNLLHPGSCLTQRRAKLLERLPVVLLARLPFSHKLVKHKTTSPATTTKIFALRRGRPQFDFVGQ